VRNALLPDASSGALALDSGRNALAAMSLPAGGAANGELSEGAASLQQSAAAPPRKYKGAALKSSGKWYAQLSVPGMNVRETAGPFKSAEEAARAYDAAVRARGLTGVNFPLPGTGETQAVPRIVCAVTSARRKAPVAMPPGAARFKGVCWFKWTGEWQVQFWNPDARKMETLDYFPVDQAEAAARFYDAAVRARGGTCVNFPQQGETQAHFDEQVRQAAGSTPFRGVSKSGSKYRAQAYFAGDEEYLGYFETAEDAARAHDKWLREMGAPAIKLNFSGETDGAGAAGGDAAPARKRKRASSLSAAHADVSSDAGEEGASDESDAAMDAAATDAAAATPQPAGAAPSDGGGGAAEAAPSLLLRSEEAAGAHTPDAGMEDASPAGSDTAAPLQLAAAAAPSDGGSADVAAPPQSSELQRLQAALQAKDAALSQLAAQLAASQARSGALEAQLADSQAAREEAHARIAQVEAELERAQGDAAAASSVAALGQEARKAKQHAAEAQALAALRFVKKEQAEAAKQQHALLVDAAVHADAEAAEEARLRQEAQAAQREAEAAQREAEALAAAKGAQLDAALAELQQQQRATAERRCNAQRQASSRPAKERDERAPV
jgi:hypothetical protein